MKTEVQRKMHKLEMVLVTESDYRMCRASLIDQTLSDNLVDE